MATSENSPSKVVILGNSRIGLGVIGAHAMARELLASLPEGSVEVEVFDKSTTNDTYVTAEMELVSSVKKMNPLYPQPKYWGWGKESKRETTELDSARKSFRSSISKGNAQIKKDAMARAKQKRLEKQAAKSGPLTDENIDVPSLHESKGTSPDSVIENISIQQVNNPLKGIIEKACESYRNRGVI